MLYVKCELQHVFYDFLNGEYSAMIEYFTEAVHVLSNFSKLI